MRATLAVGLVTSLLASARAFAQPAPADAEEAARLFEEGVELRDGGRFSEACDRFARSYRLDKGSGTQLQLGDCAERQGQLARAWHWFDDVSRGDNPDAAAYAKKRADAVRTKLGAIHIAVLAPGTYGVVINGRSFTATNDLLEVEDPGTVDVDITGGLAPLHQKLALAAGQTAELSYPPRTEIGPGEPPLATPPSHLRRNLGIGGIALGAVGIGGSVALAWHSYSDYNGCTTCVSHASYNRGLWLDDGIAAAGVALAAVGVYLVVTRHHGDVIVSPTGTGASVSGHF